MEVINNIDKTLGDDLKEEIPPKSRLSITASFFSIYAYEALKKELEEIDELRFIFNSPTFVTDKMKKGKREFYIPKLVREKSLYGSEFEIRLKNELTLKAVASECGEWIRKKVTFKSNNTSSTLQGFINLENKNGNVSYMPVNAFTTVDLGYEKGDVLSNMVNKMTDYPISKHYFELFDQLWNDKEKLVDVTSQVVDHISTVYKENPPEFIYFFVLYNIFNEFLDDISQDLLPNEATGFKDTEIWKRLYNFQRDAVIGGVNKLDKYNGCILADSVGLGKTFTALGIIKYYELRNKSALVLCPKKLGENWLTFRQNLINNVLHKDRFRYDVLYHTDLSRYKGISNGIPLDRINWGNYDLLVIDESHNFRNNDPRKEKETRYQRLMREVIQSGVRTKVLMLSATPVNNRFNDLKNQMALAYEGNPKNISSTLKIEGDIEEVFRKAQGSFSAWSRLPTKLRTTDNLLGMLDFDFFEILDSITIARSRKHIQTYYDTKEIGPFPERLKPISLNCDLTKRHDVIGYNDIFKELSRLSLALYAPFNYILPSRLQFYEKKYDTVVKTGGSLKQMDRERSLQVLMRINLLKRLESSVHAFRLTMNKILAKIDSTINLIDGFESQAMARSFEHTELVDVNLDDDDWLDEDYSITGNIRINLSDMDRIAWRESLERDSAIFSGLLAEMEKITPEYDEKLITLKKTIAQKISHPINQENRKILIFTAFADTASYLFEHISAYAKDEFHLETAKVVGTDQNQTTIKKIDKGLHTILTCFAPRAKDKHLTMPDLAAEYDILIATDCVSEGQNMQDCDYLINYDIHWNPVRIVQRFGRIDRIGSPNQVIQLVNFWPNLTLDEYINLKERVENRMVIVDMTATGEDNVLSNQSSDLEYRKEQLKKLQEQSVDFDELNTGVSITDLGLNDFRMDLVKYVQEHGDLDNVPPGLHTVTPSRSDKSAPPGVIYILRNINSEVNINNQNRLHPYYLVYIDNNGQVVSQHPDAKKTLDLMRLLCKNRPDADKALYEPFNKETRDGRKMDHYSYLLEQAIRSIIDVKEESDIDSLFSSGGTTALLNTVKGLEDFELVSFIVVRNEHGSA